MQQPQQSINPSSQVDNKLHIMSSFLDSIKISDDKAGVLKNMMQLIDGSEDNKNKSGNPMSVRGTKEDKSGMMSNESMMMLMMFAVGAFAVAVSGGLALGAVPALPIEALKLGKEFLSGNSEENSTQDNQIQFGKMFFMLSLVDKIKDGALGLKEMLFKDDDGKGENKNKFIESINKYLESLSGKSQEDRGNELNQLKSVVSSALESNDKEKKGGIQEKIDLLFSELENSFSSKDNEKKLVNFSSLGFIKGDRNIGNDDRPSPSPEISKSLPAENLSKNQNVVVSVSGNGRVR